MAAVAEIAVRHLPVTVQQHWLALALEPVTKLCFSGFLHSFAQGLGAARKLNAANWPRAAREKCTLIREAH